MPQTAGIVIIGDEILSGKFADENAPFLIAELRTLGVDLRRIAVIPDDIEDIGETVAAFSARFDHVFTSGGVGPTHDDVTIAGIARGFGTRVLIDPRLEHVLRDHWGPTMPEANLRLAHVPEGCELVGDDARWPVVRYRNVFVLPGVPALFKRKFLSVKSLLAPSTRAERRLYCVGDEGVLAPHLELVVAEFADVKLGSYPRFHETTFKVILTLEGSDEPRVEAAFERLKTLLAELVVDAPV